MVDPQAGLQAILDSVIGIATGTVKSIATSLIATPFVGIARDWCERHPTFKVFGSIRVAQLERTVLLIQKELAKIRCLSQRPAEEFANVAFRVFEAGAREHREFKVRLLAAACAHTANESNRDPFDVQLEMIEAVDRLQPFHVVMLKYIDDHHSQKDPATGCHQHNTTCSFDELVEADFDVPEPRRLWVSQSILLLNQVGAIRMFGGGTPMPNASGDIVINVDLTSVAEHASIGLSAFGCKLLRYVANAFSDDDATSTG